MRLSHAVVDLACCVSSFKHCSQVLKSKVASVLLTIQYKILLLKKSSTVKALICNWKQLKLPHAARFDLDMS